MDDHAPRGASLLIGLSSTLLVVAAVTLLTWLIGRDAPTFGGWPAPMMVGALAIGVQWIAWVPAALARTERYFDLIGSLTYLATTGLAFALGSGGPRATMVLALVWLWALRLGSFLFRRIRRDGKDGRMDRLKVDPFRFLMVWNLQALWVAMTALAAWTVLVDPGASAWLPTDALGLAVFLVGFAIEVVADRQKYAFRADPANAHRFIDVGLWSWSQHPNYFGEILLWTGIAILSAGTFEGTQWVALISPAFVFVLLTRVSGIPLLDARAKKAWGEDADYLAYRERTPVLFPRPPRRD